MHQPKMRDTASKICFTAKLLRPKATAKAVSWTFLTLPEDASAELPSRGMASVEGTLNGFPFRATLEPDGQGGHWLKIDRKMRETAGAQAGDRVTLEFAPVAVEPEPEVPDDLRKALTAAPPLASKTWLDITPLARRDWIHWITSGKRAETRTKRMASDPCRTSRVETHPSLAEYSDHLLMIYRHTSSNCERRRATSSCVR